MPQTNWEILLNFKEMLNQYNFIQWQSTSVTPECYYALPLVAGDEMKVFVNIEFNDANDPFANMKVGLWNIDEGAWYINDIATLSQVVLSGDLYSVYFEWTVPILPRNHFVFRIWGTSIDEIWSNHLLPRSQTDYTSFVQYRNSENALGFRYEDAPTFYNQLRIDLWTGRPSFNENSVGYETYDGNFIKVKSDIQKLRNFETRFFDEIAHEAFFAMLAHSDVWIDSVLYRKPDGEEYTIAWHEFDDNVIAAGAVNLMRVDYSKAIKSCSFPDPSVPIGSGFPYVFPYVLS